MTNHRRGFIPGLRFVGLGFRLIFRKGIRRYVLMPLLINVLLFSTAIWFLYQQLSRLSSVITDWTPGWLDWLSGLIWPLAVAVVSVGVYYGFTMMANLIAAPFNSLLAERVEASLRGRVSPSGLGFSKVPAMVGRTMWSEVRKLLYQLKWLILLTLVSLIPGLNIIASPAWFYFGARMMAINYLDYPMGNHDYYFAEVKKQISQDRLTCLGFGVGLLGLTMIPGLNFFVMPVGVATATAYWVNN